MYKNKLLIKPSEKNYKAIISKIRKVIKDHTAWKQEDLIRKLNPIIRGWVNFHKHNVASEAFSHLDNDVWISLWKWCRQRHPNKNHKWIAKKYFHRDGNRTWIFSAQDKGVISIKLMQAGNTHITRFVKTKSEATPFDPKWDSYFEKRDTMRMMKEIKGKRKLNYLYKLQNGRCPCCGKRLTIEEGFQIHLFTDMNYNSNMIIVHEKCDKSLHASVVDDELVPPMWGL
jgi:RNA-directed DNA polymerase